jgi:hypothetical protein
MATLFSKIKDYGTSTRTNPSVLFELLFGSQQAVNKTATVESLNKKLSEDFRKQIEANLPVFYLLDAEEIVNGMLEDALHPDLNANRKRGLSKYILELRSSNIEFFEYYGNGFLTFENDYYNEVDKDGNTIEGFEASYVQAYNYLVSKKQDIIKDVHKAIQDNLKNSVNIADVADSLNEVTHYINGTIADLSSVGLSAPSVQRATSVVSASAAGRIMRESFKRYPKTKIADAEKLINGFNSATMTLAVAANYELATTDNHNAATEAIKKYLKRIPITLTTLEGSTININVKIFPNDKEFKVGNIVAAGHAAVKSSNKGIIGINTPGLQIALAILQSANTPVPGVVKAFIGETGHEAYAIEVSTDYENFAGNLINLQASLLRSQRSAINSGVISQQESAFLDNLFKETLGKSYLDVRKDFIAKVKSGKVGTFLTTKFAQSPTLIQSIENRIVAAITGDGSYKGTKGNSGAEKQKPKTNNIKSSQASGGSKIQPKSSNKQATRASSTAKQTSTVNLTSLQNLINSHLQDVVAANMGDGSQRSILNYRTGRFAGSVKVEKMSQSREGMITAFYSYMKNPYQTFEPGFRQGNPKTRDPKLLIAKSIREIAETRVANRMRAVSV